MSVEAARLAWTHPERYDAVPETDPRAVLALGSRDDRGAAALGKPQTTYCGFVVQLQTDLLCFGFDPGGIDGVFGAKTEGAVRFFQEAASTCPHRSERRTYDGSATGVIDDATRGEITTWRLARYRRHLEALDSDREERLLCEVARVLWGPTAFSKVAHDPAGGLKFGLLGFGQRDGALGDIVWRMWSTSPRSFRFTFGTRGEQILLPSLTSRDEAERMSVDLTTAEWTRRFVKAGEVDFWQREQLNVGRARVLAPTVRIARATGLLWERAIAVLLLVHIEQGARDTVALAREIGHRPPGRPVRTHVLRAVGILRESSTRAQGTARLVETLLSAADFDDCAYLFV